MSRHLLNKHDIDTSKNARADDAAQSKLNFGAGPASFLKGATRDEVLFKMTLWLANSFRPFTTVEDPDFREFIRMLRPDFELPKRDKIRILARKIALIIKAQVCSLRESVLTNLGLQVKEFLQVHAKWICFTTDGWSSRQGKGHVAITVHALSADFHMFEFCLAATELAGARARLVSLSCLTCRVEDHTAQNLTDFYMRVFDDYDIVDKVIAGTTDNAPNAVASIQQNEKWAGIKCFIHTLQLAIRDALKVWHRFRLRMSWPCLAVGQGRN